MILVECYVSSRKLKALDVGTFRGKGSIPHRTFVFFIPIRSREEAVGKIALTDEELLEYVFGSRLRVSYYTWN